MLIFLRSFHRKLVLQFNQLASMPSSALLEQSLYSEPDQTLATRKGHLNYLAHQSTKIVYWSELVHNHHVPIGRTELIKEPTLYLVNVEDTFVSPVIAIPYDLSDPDQIGWLFIEPVDKFLEILRTVMREMICKS